MTGQRKQKSKDQARVAVYFRAELDVYKNLKDAADADNRSVSSMLAKIVRLYFEQKGAAS
jgi:hypothetical protein